MFARKVYCRYAKQCLDLKQIIQYDENFISLPL